MSVLVCSFLYVPAWRHYRKERAAKTLERFYVEKDVPTPKEVLEMRNALMKIGKGLNRASP
jgi:hypothetical protein